MLHYVILVAWWHSGLCTSELLSRIRQFNQR